MKKQLNVQQRYETFAYLQSNIANRIGVHRATITREIKRNADGRSGLYKPALAQRKRDDIMYHRNHFYKMDDVMKTWIEAYLY